MTVRIRAASTFALAFLAAVTLTAAPQATPGAILNAAELRQAISATGGPDHAKLAAHFTALADRYAADSARHAEMAKGYASNTSRAGGPDMRGHCTALANLSAGMEKSARELAKFHADGARAAGTGAGPSPAAPHAADHAKMPSMADKAPAAGDHAAASSYFTSLADRYTADADSHAAMAALYRTGRMAGMADHCERLARDARAAAKQAREAAAQR
jgi:hypothetical protein